MRWAWENRDIVQWGATRGRHAPHLNGAAGGRHVAVSGAAGGRHDSVSGATRGRHAFRLEGAARGCHVPDGRWHRFCSASGGHQTELRQGRLFRA